MRRVDTQSTRRVDPGGGILGTFSGAPITLLLLLLACSPEAVDPGTDDTGADTGAVTTPTEGGLLVTQQVATVVRIEWPAPDGATTWLEYGLDGAFDLSSPEGVAAEGRGDATVLGLKAGATYQVRAVWLDEGGGRVESEAVELDTAMFPEGIVASSLEVADLERAQPGGFVLLSLMQTDRTWIVLLDREGDLVWWYDVGEALLAPTVRLSRDGNDVLMGVYDRDQQQDLGEIRRVSLRTGQVTTTRTELAHHDFLELPDGRLAWLAYDPRVVDFAGSEAEVVGDSIVIGKEGRVEGDDIETLFSFHDVLQPSPVCSHTELEVLGLGGLDWTHANSLAYLDDTGQILVVARHLDTVIALDAETAEPAWQIGGEGGLAGEPFPAFDHGHLSDAWDGGLLLFDNGEHRINQHSRVVEYALDPADGSYRLTWEYWQPDKAHIPILGDARRLPSGNKLVSWASLGRLTELTPDGDEAWVLQSEVGALFGRVRWIDDLYAPTRGQ